ncbi:radical SAM protein [Arthrobacter pityocampae]|uniref:Radical SAM protein n=1 Tax=Arthrobacter pityocampae TaxID=547334 RepID=A0A2S5IZ98_9MICC|nr:radical SAM protein [Arthrobacter pityocampae]PPB49863.1 radical SAM protein [Arthrobacter pityocampae]
MPEQRRHWKSRSTEHGVHFFQRQTGINLLLEELKLPEQTWAVAPRYVSVALTNACELKCPYCYAAKRPARLGARETSAWLKELDRGGCLGVGFGGGEPTLHSEFSTICQTTAIETDMAVSFTTHGHRITEELATQLRGYVHFIRVSVDGIGATYEKNRGRTFDDLQRRIDLIAGICRFGINVVVTDQTAWELNSLLDYAERWGAEELLLLPEQGTAGRSGIGELAYAEMIRWLASHRRSNIRVGISRMADLSGVSIADAFPMEDRLSAHAHIDANGGLRTDAFTQKRIPIRESVIEALRELREAV